MARVSIIAAIGKNRELGRRNELIWRIREDLQRFKKITTNHPIIMGRKTYESIGKPLPERTNIVVTRSVKEIPGCVVTHSFEAALELAQKIDPEEVFVIGGAELYAQAVPFADRMYLTLIESEVADADVFFPPYKDSMREVYREECHDHVPPYSWTIFEREIK